MNPITYSPGIRNSVSIFCFLVIAFNFSFAQNAIVTENSNAGVAASQWDIPSNGDGTFGDKSIQGFATTISVNKGSAVSFKITVTTGTNKQFGIKIYRIGYYQGNGARLMADLGTAFTGISQAACSFDNTTGLTDCGNWTTATSWTVPSTAVSGVYVAKLTRSAAGGGGSSHIVFIVRDDASTSALYFKTSDATWQAYNSYGGYSLYVGAGMPFNHGDKVSYNRPFLTRDGGGGGGSSEDWLMNAEYPMIRFLERNGYDISYTTDVDIASSTTNLILNHKVFLSVGHDEYWSKPERDGVEAARAAGKHLAFFSGNEIYWKTRWENSVDGSNTPFRTMVCYKEGTLATLGENACGGKCDPTTEWTGLWRDGCSFPSGNGCKPENALSGEISWDGNQGTILVPDTYKKLRFWRNTSVANLATGATATLTNGTLGYEWDWEQYQNSYPPGRITMSNTASDGHVHKLSLYKSSFGGLVFGAGTVQWAWGLDATHDRGSDPANTAMQQATVNLFADMSVQPATIQSGLTLATASTDVTPPTATTTSPANNATITSTAPVTFSGTATDANTVAGVEISFDGGTTWAAANGTTNWTYQWAPGANGVYNVLVRGIDDSGNYPPAASATKITITVSINLAQNCPCNVFGAPAPTVGTLRDNTGGIVLGMKFRAFANGVVTGIRFYKNSGNTGTHTGLLYSNTGTLLAQATFTGETASGWQQVNFSTPVNITGDQTYVAAYLSGSGFYSASDGYFTQPISSGPLTALADGVDGANGIYVYSNTPAFPTNSYQQSNYWVDLIYNSTSVVTAVAGPNQTITLPASSVTLNGSGSTGTITSYLWTLVSGPNTPAITTPSSVSTTVTGLIQGTYVFKLSVNGGASSSQVTITVSPALPPTSNAGANQTITLPASSVTLNGSASTGTITSYLWTLVSGPNTPAITTPASVSTTVTGLIQGSYVFQLSVNGGASTSTTQVTVNPPVPLSINVFPTQIPAGAVVADGHSVTLGMKFRSSAAGSISGVRFYKGAGMTGTHIGLLYNNAGTLLAQVTFTGETSSGWQTATFASPVTITSGVTYIVAYFNPPGLYEATQSPSANSFNTAIVNSPLTGLADGTDGVNGVYNYGASPTFPTLGYLKSNYWVDAVFTSSPPAPVANAGPNQTITLPTSTVTLNGSGSTGTITSYAWTQVSGPNTAVITSPTAISTTVTGLIQGSYVFTLTVNGGVSQSQVTITVSPAPAPVANAGPNQNITLPTSTVTLNGSGSTGTITSYAWTQVSGPNTATITSPAAVSTTVTGLIQGSYVFKLTLNGGVSQAQVTITVSSVPPPTANAGANQSITLPASSVTLNGSGSTGTITSYAWTLISGPNSPVIVTPTAVTTNVTGLIAGTYLFQLSLNNGASVAQTTVNVITNSNFTIFTGQSPTGPIGNDGTAIEVGVKFQSSVNGTVTGIRFYKSSGNSGTHTGELYTSGGTRLASAVFTNETSTGWQQVLFSSPVTITANTTYVAAYFSSSGFYSYTDNYFTSAVTDGPITALADGTDGTNGVYAYTSAPAFPSSSYHSSNYWVDVIFNGVFGSPSNTNPGILVTSPAGSATGVSTNSAIYCFFSKALNPSTVTTSSVFLQSGGVNVPSSVVYNSSDSSVALTPNTGLSNSTSYTVTIKGGSSVNRIKDFSGNSMAADTSWTFTTCPLIVNAPPANGPGGPILLISSTANPFSRYPVEILRAEGWNAFNALDISAVTTTEINKYDVVIVGDFALTAAQVTMLSNWVTAGGTLIAFHPDPQLATLLGITPNGGTLSDKYLLVNTSSGPGVGIVNQTIQYHGPANLYSANAGTNILATIYTDATTASTFPAITSRTVGTSGGQAIAFAYDLAKSVVYTRQGNPAWVGQNRDAQDAVIRADNLFFGNASFDPQPDWVNLNKVAIPQADEQQRLLTNIIIAGNFDHKPLPRFWFLPKGKKAAVVMTGDDHAHGGTAGRFNQYIGLSSSNAPSDVANWNAIRSTSYMYPNSPISNAQIAAFQNQGFEMALHVNPNCSVWTPTELQNYFDNQLQSFTSEYYVAAPSATHRIHCLSWSDWSTLPKTEIQRGIRLNVSYYYWPPSWINNRPGMFTGSGMPMRFADLDGSLIDSYQVPSQMTDESGQTYPFTIDSLLIRATGPTGYFGVFCANMHTDQAASPGSDAIVQSALSLQIPIVSSKQMLDWLDGRNNSTFSNYTWTNSKLSFSVTQDFRALNLKGMLPNAVSAGNFISLTLNGAAVNTTTDSIKGVRYILFDAVSGNYVATYGLTGTTNSGPTSILATPETDTAEARTNFFLGQNYPNPANQSTRINYGIASASHVEMVLYDIQGRPVKVLVNSMKQAGNYTYELSTAELAKGMYFYKMRAGDFADVKKLIIE
jgi:Domain of unknown function (DUF4082)/Bacterial Ig-like domain/Bacterial Ig domain/Secretion system C-terminal sorting domain